MIDPVPSALDPRRPIMAYWDTEREVLRSGWQTVITWDESTGTMQVGRIKNGQATYVGFSASREEVIEQLENQLRFYLSEEASET